MKKITLFCAMVATLGFGTMQLAVSGWTCEDCLDQCVAGYYSCYASGEDERVCIIDFDECRDDCETFYCN